MKGPVLPPAFFPLLGLLLWLPALVDASPPPADSLHYLLSFDYEQWQREHPRPAAKGLTTLDIGEPLTVRMIYFLPNNRPYRAEVVQSMKREIFLIRTFYAEQMAAHGYGARTFRMESDATGAPMIHRVDGQHPDSHYLDDTFLTVVEEVGQTFNGQAPNVHFIVIDNSTNQIKHRGGNAGGAAWSRRGGGEVVVPGEFHPKTAAHELGHAFGLKHNFHDDAYIMSYNPSADQLSACSAEFLSVNPYFDSGSPSGAVVEDEAQETTIELLSPSEYSQGATSVPVRLKLKDLDGLHQVILLVITESYQEEVMACRGLSGEKETVAEFDYDGVIPSSTFATLFNPVEHPIRVQAVDMEGNVSNLDFALVARSPYHLATLGGHAEVLYSVVVSPDGSTLVSMTENMVILWDVETLEQIGTLKGPTDAVSAVSFSPAGAILATGSRDGTVTLWDVKTREQIATLEGHRKAVLAMSFSPDGVILATVSSRDDTVILWDVETREQIATLEGHTDAVLAVSFSPAGAILATGSGDGTVILWDAETREQIATLEGHRKAVLAVSFSPAGAILAAGSGDDTEDMVILWDVESREQIASLEGLRYPQDLAFSPDGATLATGFFNSVILWDVDTREQVAILEGPRSNVNSVSFFPDGRTLAAGFFDGTITLWDVAEWTSPRPQTLVKLSGDNQEGKPGTALAEPLVVEVRDRDGSPLPGARVTFTVTEGDGKLSGRSDSEVSDTDANGRTQSILTLGLQPGINTVEISVSGIEVIFNAMGVGPPTLPTMEEDHRTWNLPYGAIVRLGKGGVSQDDRSLLFSSDGQRLTVTNKVGIWIYDVATFRPLALIPFDSTIAWVGGGSVTRDDVAYSPDLTTLAFVKGYGVELWDAATQTPIASLEWYSDGTTSVSLSPDGRTLASGDFKGRIRLWDLVSGTNIDIPDNRGTITSSVFSPDGAILASGAADNLVKLWDVETGTNIAILEGHRNLITSLAFSPDGTSLASGSADHTAKLWDVATGTNTATFFGHKSMITSLAFSPDGTTLASGEFREDAGVKLWDVATGANTTTLEGHWFPVTSVAFSSDRTLASGSWYDGAVRLWDLATGNSTTLPGHTDEISSVAFSPDGSTLASAAWPDGTVKLWDVDTQTHFAILKGHWFPLTSSVEYSLDGTIGIAFSPDGRMLATGAQDNTVKLWEVATGTNTTTLHGHTGRVYSVAFSPDGRTLASGSWDNTVKLWDLASGTNTATLHGHTGRVYSVAFSPDGRTLASGARDNTVKLWDVVTETETANLHGHTHWVLSVAFSPDGTMLASGSIDKTVKLWDIETGTHSATLDHVGQVYFVAFSPDGGALASTSSDSTVKVWDVSTKGILANLDGHNASTFTAAFSPDGTTLASGSEDGTVLLWDLQLVQPHPESLARLSGNEQQGLVGVALPEPFVVSVLDQYGDPFPGATVEFFVSTGGGILSKSRTITDANGRAASTLTLGPNPGSNTVEVTVTGLEPVIFTSIGETIPQTLSKISGDKQEGKAGSALPEPFVVEVRDQSGNPLESAQVRFSVTAGDGTLSAEAVTTDSSGRASSTLTLGRGSGTNTVEVTVADLDPVTFSAIARATPDFDGDGVTNFADFFLFADAFGGTDARFDLDGSGVVDFGDFFIFADAFGQPARAKLLALAAKLIGLPEGPQLQQNIPNPFNSQTVIPYFLLAPGHARLEVFALTGQRVAVLHQGPQPAGLHRIHWDGRGAEERPLASGIYFYRLVTAEGALTRKLVLLR